MNVVLVYVAFVLGAWATFRLCRPPVAALVVFLGGWILLPVGVYPPGSSEHVSPYWITGAAVPSEMWVSKAWIAPAAAVLGAIAFDREALSRLRPAWIDLPVVLWCLWPLIQSAWIVEPSPPGWSSSLYLAGTWGLTWLLGRAYFATHEAQVLMLKGLALSAVLCLPFSIVEGIWGARVYGWVYEPHPFRLDGTVRYVGHRPLGFFENGNQFGLWIALSALAAVWLARTLPNGSIGRRFTIIAAVAVAMAVAAQSVGALLLLVGGWVLLSLGKYVAPRTLATVVAASLIVGGAAYVSGIVPITKIGKDTVVGRQIVDGFRAVGRGSFPWRISQDQKLLPEATARPVSGTGQWDWWRAKDVRPWGLWLLVLGQFGGVGLGLALGLLLMPALRVAWRAPRASGWRPDALPLLLATLVVLTVLDAFLNSFIFFPALLAAGGLAVTSTKSSQVRYAAVQHGEQRTPGEVHPTAG